MPHHITPAFSQSALHIRNPICNTKRNASRQILMEIKIPDTAPVWLAHLLSEIGAFPASFSKYGTCYRENIAGMGLSGKSEREVGICA